MNVDESIKAGGAAPEINEFRTENEEIENESGDLNSQDGEEDEEEAELSPKLAEGFFEIETVRRKRVRKGQVQYLIKWRGWPETANTWEPYENLVSCFDVIEAFEDGLRSGKHRSRKRKRRSSGLVPQAKKKTQGTPGASTSSPLTVGRVKFDEGNFIIPFMCDVSHENGGRSGMGDIGNDDAIEQRNGNGSASVCSQFEKEKDQYEMDVNLGESTGIQLTNGGSSLLDMNILESQVCFENGHQKVDGEGLVQANGRLRKRRKAASVKRFSQEQTPQTPRVINYAAIEQGNGNRNVSADICPQVEEGRDNYEMGVNPGAYAGTPLMNWGSSRVAVDILEPKTSETICFQNGHQKVDGKGLVQADGRLRNRRKAASVKRFSQEQTPRATIYAAIEQGNGNGNGSVDIPPQVEEGRDNYEMGVNPCEYTGTALMNWGSSRVAVDILEPKTSEAICFENGHQKVDGEGLAQANGRLRNRRKAASVRRFSQEQTPRVTNYAAIEQGKENGNGSVDIPPQVEEGRDNYEMGVNPCEYTGTSLMNWGSSRVAVDILEPKTSEAICFENGHQKVDGEGLVQANGRLRNRRKAASVRRFSQEQTPRVTNYAAIEQGKENGNGNGSVDIPPQVEEGRDYYEMDVNTGEYAGTPLTNGGSNRVAVDILESKTSEPICFENEHQKVDGEGLVQGNGRLRNRRKAASVKRFNQEQTPCVTNYAAQDLTTKNTRACGIAGQNWDKSSDHRNKCDNSTDTFSITEIIKPISFSSSGSATDILVTFMARRSDGKEVMVDNKYLKANYPLLLINYYEQHLNYNATAGPDRSGREYMAG